MPDKQQSIVVGSLTVGILSTSYIGLINLICCLGVIIGGMVAVWHYTNTHRLTVPAGQGAIMGLQAGIFGGILALLLNYLLISIGIRHDIALMEFLINNLGDAMTQEQIEDLRDEAGRQVNLVAYLLQGTLTVILTAIFATIGGAIGAAVFKKGGVPPAEEF
jgi:uncharacterized protein YacL